ncbi:MAG: hypothetical protein EBX52_04370 [Proteobacteria bacterium]|nr:hypothetical protein [Pseudomonadota bacterium]
MNSQKENKGRAWSFGVNSVFVTLVVISIIGLVNFLGKQYPKKLDLTKNKIHTFSDQTEKVMKGLKDPVEAAFFGDLGSREKNRPLFDNYKKASTLFKLEWVDPNKEPTRTKAAGIKKMDTLVLTYKGRTSKIEDITEEKITNELIKMTKETKLTVCTVTGHGEVPFSDQTGGGFSSAKKGLEDQSYNVKELILPQETRIPADCSAVVMLGAVKALFPAEIKMLSDYLNSGGRLVAGLESAPNSGDQTKELTDFLQTYGVVAKKGLIIDAVSKMLGVDASVPIIATFNKDTALGKDFSGQCFFPFSRPIDIANPLPEGFKAEWVGKTTPKAFAETDLAALAKGIAKFDQGADLQGPLTTVITVSGKKKDSKAEHETRLVVFSSSQFANNQFSRFGGNLDLFLNGVSWAVEDESMISIRAKEEDAGKVELTQNQGIAIFWLCVILIPLAIAVFGIVIWVRRKKL